MSTEAMDTTEDTVEDLGWKTPEETATSKRRKGKGRADAEETEASTLSEEQRREEASVSFLRSSLLPSDHQWSHQARRTRLLRELAARLNRDKMLRYTERELEMQKLLMGKGGSRKLQGVEKVEDDDDDDERNSEDEQRPKKVDEKTWKPRVYKWRVERKR